MSRLTLGGYAPAAGRAAQLEAAKTIPPIARGQERRNAASPILH
jgi:hypothetical protein